MHDVRGTAAAEGRANVERGRSLLARLVSTILGFPRTGSDIPVHVQFEVAHGAEIWRRKFGSAFFSSRHIGWSEYLLCERFGPLTFATALVVADSHLSLVLRRWSAFGLPLAMWLAPRSDSYESVEQDKRIDYRADVPKSMIEHLLFVMRRLPGLGDDGCHEQRP